MVIILDDKLKKELERERIENTIIQIDKDIANSNDKAEVMDLFQEQQVLKDRLEKLENEKQI